MWSKIYLAVLAVAVIVIGFFIIYANSWLGSIGNPRDALAGYQFYANLSSTSLWISTAFLLILANIILWTSRRGWAMWVSFAFFAFFVILLTFWLAKAGYNFQQSDGFFFTPLVGVILIIIAGGVVFFNQLLNLRLQEKMYPTKPEEIPESNEVVEKEE